MLNYIDINMISKYQRLPVYHLIKLSLTVFFAANTQVNDQCLNPFTHCPCSLRTYILTDLAYTYTYIQCLRP